MIPVKVKFLITGQNQAGYISIKGVAVMLPATSLLLTWF